jgi:hypothetical protein
MKNQWIYRHNVLYYNNNNFKTFKTNETWKINECNHKLTFWNALFEKSNNDVCLADAILVYGDSVNWRSTVTHVSTP